MSLFKPLSFARLKVMRVCLCGGLRWVESPPVLGTFNELGTHCTFFTTPFTFSSLSVCLLISLHRLANPPFTLSLSFFNTFLQAPLFLSWQKDWWFPLEKKKNKIEIMAYVQSARGANQWPSWERHRRTEVVVVVVKLVVGGKPGPLSRGD